MDMKKLLVILFCLMTLFAASGVWAHMLWLNVDNYQPDVGEAIHIEIAWGHKFPKDEIIKKERLKCISALDPMGNMVPLKEVSEGQYELTVKQKGAYLVSAQINPGVYTKTTDGFKMQTKKGLKNAIQCVSYDMRTKAIIIVGGQVKGLSRNTDDLLDIIPLESPNWLQGGGSLPVKVFFQGKPLFREYLYATYAGFSNANETYAFASMLNKEGQTSIKTLEKGVWLVKIPYKLAYPDPKECDEYYYCSTLTFEIK
jgi:uncharacterized GH25 family protein